MDRCKGMRDLLPEDMERFRRIEAAFRDSCQRWGYAETRTPVLEYLHLFTTAGTLTPAMLSRVYSFLDWDGWSGERVVLRPEGTIPTARLFLSRGSPPPARLCYLENFFSFEGTGQEARERWQGGAEFLGGASPQAEGELISLALEVLGRLGFSPQVKLAHVGVLRDLFFALGEGERWHQALEGSRELATARPELGETLGLLFELRGRSPGYLRNLQALLLPRFPSLKGSLEDFVRVAELLTSLGIAFEIDMAGGGEFEYYTGAVFQFFLGGERVGSGGRYDNLLPLLGGQAVPAAGFGLYLDRLMARLEDRGPRPSVILVRAGVGVGQERAFALALELRSGGYRVEVGTSSSPPQFLVEVGDGLQVAGPSGKVVRLPSAPEVLGFLKEQGAVKISPT